MDKSTYKCIRMNAEILQIGLQTDRPKNREFNRHVEVWTEKGLDKQRAGVNLAKLFFFVDEEFFRFLLLIQVVLQKIQIYSYVTNTQA